MKNKETAKHISLPATVTVKFNVVATKDKGETLGIQIINPETENETFRKHLISDAQSCEIWIFSKTVHEMDKIERGREYSKDLKEIEILQFNLPKKASKNKLPDGESFLEKVKKKIQDGIDTADYHFKIVVHVIGTNDYFVFSKNKIPVLTKDPY